MDRPTGPPCRLAGLDEADDDPLRWVCTYFGCSALLAEGLTYAEIAERLVVSLNTVRFHVKEIYGKLGSTARRRPWRGRGRWGCCEGGRGDVR